MKDIMVDFETYGPSKRCVILTIGLLAFDVKTGEIGEGMHINVNVQDQETKYGRERDESTVAWWERQTAEAKSAVQSSIDNEGCNYEDALDIAAEFIKSFKGATLWSNGANFDIAIFEDMFALTKKRLPWIFWKTRCVRTLHDICKEITGKAFKKTVQQPTVAHNALEDCKYQARYCSKAYNELRKGAHSE
jgi:hypothetical protein